jgi:hypothetical protein
LLAYQLGFEAVDYNGGEDLELGRRRPGRDERGRRARGKHVATAGRRRRVRPGERPGDAPARLRALAGCRVRRASGIELS